MGYNAGFRRSLCFTAASCLSFGWLAGAALADNHTEEDCLTTLDGMRDGVTKAVDANFQCLAEIINDLTEDLADANARAETLRGEVAALRSALAPGMVAAFDGAQYHQKGTANPEKSGCPEGWVRFVEAEGRFVVGAVPISDGGVGPGPDDFELRQKGGARAHVLTKEEVPAHVQKAGEKVYLVDAIDPSKVSGLSEIMATVTRQRIPVPMVDATGAGQRPDAHDNMPPFIALYYCILQ